MASPALDPDVQAFRMPAEWEPHEATWLGWPHNLSDWPGRFAPIPWVYAEIVRKLAEGEIVRILVSSKSNEAKARRILERVGALGERVEFFRFPTDRGWTRDFGPICVRREHPKPEVAVTRFRFNGWAKYEDHKKDDLIAERAAKALGLRLRRAVHKGRPVVLEGGSHRRQWQRDDPDAPRSACSIRRPGAQPGLQASRLRAGVPRVAWARAQAIWLGSGIAGDDTHGHVDDLCRFVNATTIVAVPRAEPEGRQPPGARGEPRAAPVARVSTTARGSRWSRCRCRRPLVFDGRRLPASYANFYIGQRRGVGAHLQRSERPPGARNPGRSASATAPSSASTPSSWSGASARSTA